MAERIDYMKVCFVIMPFRKKKVGDAEVDFDTIYDRIFKRAIEQTPLPAGEGGGFLVAKRTDKEFASSVISREMFRYLEHSRFAMTDISGLNANVLYELGVRHRARASGTAIFRQAEAAITDIPFDIKDLPIRPYDYQPEEKAAESCALITQVLTESLEHNKVDNLVKMLAGVEESGASQPTGRTAAGQPGPKVIEDLLHEAENAIRNIDRPTAIARYRRVVDKGGATAETLLRLGLLLKEQEEWNEALKYLTRAVEWYPNYSDAHRELGIVAGRLGKKTAEASLRRAIELNPNDFDALASLGGILRRKGQKAESASQQAEACEHFTHAYELYKRATKVSRGDSYPLLNQLKLQARLSGKLELTPVQKIQLVRAEQGLRARVVSDPPYDAPWSFFDLAEIRLYLGDSAGFLKYIDEGIMTSTGPTQPGTFRSAVRLLMDIGVDLPGLKDGIAKLDEGIAALTF